MLIESVDGAPPISEAVAGGPAVEILSKRQLILSSKWNHYHLMHKVLSQNWPSQLRKNGLTVWWQCLKARSKGESSVQWLPYFPTLM